MVLLEPNPFHLLQQAGRADAYREAGALRDHVKCFGALGDRARVAERFADYWLGDGSWAAMPDKRRTAFAESLPPNFHGWDAVMGEHAAIDARGRSPAKTLVVSDRTTRRPIRAIVDLFAAGCPHGSFRTIAEGGHMAPLARPDLVNRIVREFLDAG
jgi:pimeloyl-ACP methyl ester carboxylesterase